MTSTGADGTVHMENEALRLSLAPQHGAAITAMEARVAGVWQPVLAPPPPVEGRPPALGAAMFAMVPFANRARDNVLAAAGARFVVPPNTAEPLALHGTGWERSWRVDARERASSTLTLSVGDDDPFAFASRLSAALDGATAHFALSVRNTGTAVIPAGLGFHPYFPRRESTSVRFNASTFWLEGPDHLPTDPVSLPPELDFADGGALPGSWRNNCYSGWDGHALIAQPDFGHECLLAGSEALGELMLYTPQATPVFALEPQTHTSGATGEPVPARARGLAALPPGAELAVDLRITVHPRSL